MIRQMGLIWCLFLLVNIDALANLSRKKEKNVPQFDSTKGIRNSIFAQMVP